MRTLIPSSDDELNEEFFAAWFDNWSALADKFDPADSFGAYCAWDEFARYIAEAQAPPLTDRDTKVRDDPEWLEAAAKYVALRTAYDELSAKVDGAKANLVGLTGHAKEQGGGLSVTRLWKRGNVDYKRVPELAGVNLEIYRNSPREETRVVFDLTTRLR